MKDKRILFTIATLIFRPWNLVLYITEYVDGDFIPNWEWPISNNHEEFKSRIVKDESEHALKEKEHFSWLTEV